MKFSDNLFAPIPDPQPVSKATELSLHSLANELRNIQLSSWVDARSHLDAAEELAREGKLEEAERRILSSISCDPDGHGIAGREALIRLYRQHGDSAKAVRIENELRVIRSITEEAQERAPGAQEEEECDKM